MTDNDITKMLLTFHCPRYEELPTLDLYLDQVISVLCDTLQQLYPQEGEKVVTGTMINNYVKCGAIDPPVKKKYSKEHLCYLFVIAILKRVFSIAEISCLFEMQKGTYPLDVAYDYFCVELENVIQSTFLRNGDQLPSLETYRTLQTDLMRSMVLAVANKVYVQVVIVDNAKSSED